jgi:hypothetical protein
MSKSIVYILLAILLTGGIVGYKMWNKPHKETSSANADVILTPQALLAEYNANESAADAKYLEKIIEIKGKVASINQVEKGGSFSLETGDPMSAVICEFEDAATIAPVKVGDELTVDIVLSRCSIK